MATILSFLPEGESIVTVSDSAVLRASRGLCGAVALMPHEIGAGRWFGYIWGRDVVDFFAVRAAGVRRVSCLHADDPDQTEAALTRLGVREADWRDVKLLAYMAVDGGRGRTLRRVSGLYCRLGGELVRLFSWQPAGDRFEADVPREEVDPLLAAEFGLSAQSVAVRRAAVEALLGELLGESVRDYGEVRRRILGQRRA
jgi:hypothetical protein